MCRRSRALTPKHAAKSAVIFSRFATVATGPSRNGDPSRVHSALYSRLWSRRGRARRRRSAAWVIARCAGRAMSVTAATVLIAVWVILLFALRAGSPHWLSLHIVGVILVLAGVLAVAVPRL